MIEIISVDDHEMISLGLERVFSQTKDIRVCHSCKTKAELVPFIESKSPEELKNMLAMLDIKLEEGSGFEVADFLLKKGVKCLMYSSFSNAGYVIKTMEHKITGFITKNALQPEILEAVHAVFSGETYIQKNLLPDMMFVNGILVTLTKKERELVDLMSEHLSNEELAQRLAVSKRTIENYVSRIFDKFNVKNRYELERYL